MNQPGRKETLNKRVGSEGIFKQEGRVAMALVFQNLAGPKVGVAEIVC